MKRILILFVILSFSLSTFAQTLGEFKPKDQSFGLNKVKNAKRVYIASFTINYQIYNEKESFKQGGSMLGGGYKGDAHAKLSVGLDGITEKGVQQVTDRLYQDFILMLQSKGLEIVSPEEAGKTATYSGFEMITGGKMNEAQFPGTLAATPTGMKYYVKKVTGSGKEKSGGFLNNPSTMYGKLSKELNDAVIADVDLFILFVGDLQAFKLAGANIRIKTDLRLAATESITMTSNAKFKMKGQNNTVGAISQAAFYHGKVPVGIGVTSSYVGGLKKGCGIDGVIEDTKIKSFAANDRDVWGVPTIYGTWYNPKNTTATSTAVIPVDEKKYTEGAYKAGKQFIEYHTAEFLKAL